MTPEEKFENEAKSKLAKYTKGVKDTGNNEITRIFLSSDEFVIYEIVSNNIADSIRIAIEPWTKEDKNNKESNFIKIRAKYVEVKGLLYKVLDEVAIKSRIAHILANAVDGNLEQSEDQLENLKLEIDSQYKNQFRNRLRYLGTVLTFVIGCIVLSVLTYNCNWFTDMPINRHLIFTVAAGAIGGFISVSRRIRQMVFEKDVDWYLYVFYGFERAIISIFGAIIIYFTIKSNFTFGVVNDLDNPIFGIMVFAFIAGFSETLIPNLLIKLEKENT